MPVESHAQEKQLPRRLCLAVGLTGKGRSEQIPVTAEQARAAGYGLALGKDQVPVVYEWVNLTARAMFHYMTS